MDSADFTWLMTPMGSRTTLREMNEIVAAMPPTVRGDDQNGSYAVPGRKSDLRDWINDRRRAYWDTAHTGGQPSKRRKNRVRADLCEITAAECNAWLRSLPPVEPS